MTTKLVDDYVNFIMDSMSQQIKEEIEESLRKSTVTLVTGGLGPTKDDITEP